jgi:Protein of unknown function (DUF2975)
MNDLDRIRRVSPWLQLVCTVLIGGFLIGHVLDWLVPAVSEFFGSDSLQSLVLAGGPLSPVQRVIGMAASLAPTAMLCLAFWHLRALFGQYAQGAVFSVEAVRRLSGFGWAIALFAPAELLTHPVLSVAVTMFNPPGHREIMIGVETEDLVALLLGGAVIVIAWVMGEARRLELDHSEIV